MCNAVMYDTVELQYGSPVTVQCRQCLRLAFTIEDNGLKKEAGNEGRLHSHISRARGDVKEEQL